MFISCPGLTVICFQSVTLERAHVRVCASVSSVFIIDIADKLLGSDWTCLMSCRCESQQMKMGILYLHDSGDARQMETNGKRLLLSS